MRPKLIAGLLALMLLGMAQAQNTCRLTPAQTEGPYYTPNPPQKTSLIEPGHKGTRVLLTGRVLNAQCQPIAGAKVDVWQTDEQGEYDNQGYRYRGYVMSDAQGNYRIETLFPGVYPGRTRHIHVKVWAPGKPVLTTQVYFPGEAGNARDGIFRPELVAKIQDDPAGGKQALFDFVVR